MRKWLPGADVLRPDVWRDLNNMVPTPVGTYHTMPCFGSATVTGGNSGTANYVTYYAWSTYTQAGTAVTYVAGETSSGAGSFYVETLSGTALTNRSQGGTNFGTGLNGLNIAFAQMGNTTLFAENGTAGGGLWSRDASGSSNFALGSTSAGKILVVHTNALLMFNLLDGGSAKPDSWMASDTGAPTTFTGGNSVAATQILHTPGEITAAAPFGGSVIVFKRRGVYRMTFVGGDVKWQVELLRPDIGVKSKHAVIDTGNSLVFLGEQGVWEFDGSGFRPLSVDFSTPVVTPLSSYYSCTASMFYPQDGCCAWFTSTGALFYNIHTGQFGKGTFYDQTGTALTGYVPVVGTWSAIAEAGFTTSASSFSFYDGMGIINVSAARFRLSDKTWDGTNSAYVTTGYIGDFQKDITIRRVIPALRNNYYTFAGQIADDGLELTGLTASTYSSTDRKRFDSLYTIKYPDGVQLTVKNRDGYDGAWEIDDLIIESTVSGAT